LKDDRLYLTHIQDCIDRIESYTSEGRVSFLADRKTQDAVLRNLQVLAESSQRLSTELTAQHPEIDWRGLAGFRNLLVHDYFGISMIRIWELLEQFVPQLKQDIALLITLGGGGGGDAGGGG
jgi:uncharacterized protein with HEPN domain